MNFPFHENAQCWEKLLKLIGVMNSSTQYTQKHTSWYSAGIWEWMCKNNLKAKSHVMMSLWQAHVVGLAIFWRK